MGIGEPARKDTATHPDGTHDRWAVNAKRLFDQGIDPYEVWIGECRKRGVEAWVSMRMNDYHFADVTNYFRNTTFCRTRRDLWVELYPCVNCFHHTSAASIRASAAAYLGARVDGIYLFNAPYVGKRDTDGRKHKEDSFGKICREGLFPAGLTRDWYPVNMSQ